MIDSTHFGSEDYPLHLLFVKHEFGDNFIVRQDGRLTLAKRLGFYKRLFSGEVDKLGQMIR